MLPTGLQWGLIHSITGHRVHETRGEQFLLLWIHPCDKHPDGTPVLVPEWTDAADVDNCDEHMRDFLESQQQQLLSSGAHTNQPLVGEPPEDGYDSDTSTVPQGDYREAAHALLDQITDPSVDIHQRLHRYVQYEPFTHMPGEAELSGDLTDIAVKAAIAASRVDSLVAPKLWGEGRVSLLK
jgi:hypothetical protein